ncbi:hypothetical protein MASR2M17_22220 [Aminivibrio sp.]
MGAARFIRGYGLSNPHVVDLNSRVVEDEIVFIALEGEAETEAARPETGGKRVREGATVILLP